MILVQWYFDQKTAKGPFLIFKSSGYYQSNHSKVGAIRDVHFRISNSNRK